MRRVLRTITVPILRIFSQMVLLCAFHRALPHQVPTQRIVIVEALLAQRQPVNALT